MGYETEYTLSIFADMDKELIGNDKMQLIKDYMESDDNYLRDLDIGYNGEQVPNELGSACCKWYDHEKDMRKMSIAIPDVIFLLEGKGEDDGDVWRMYFLNGKAQLCNAEITIVYPSFNAAELK